MKSVAIVVGIGLVLAGGGTPAARAQPGPPEVRSKAAVVLDARTGAEIFAKNADEVRPIASTTKIFVALAVRARKIALDGWTEIDREDARASRGGSRTRLDVGQTFKNLDLLRAMLMVSDNRAPTALGRAVGMTPKELVAAMNDVAKQLGLRKTRFTDTSGLRGNVSTAREMALALRAALADPVLRDVLGTDQATIQSKSGYATLYYRSTNVPLAVGRFRVIGGKTGYTRPAGYCFINGAEISGRQVVMAFLGADGKLTRFADFNRIGEWLEQGGAGSKVKVGAASSRAKPRLAVRARGRLPK